MKGNEIPTTKLANQFNMPEKLITAGLGPCLNISLPRKRGMGPNKNNISQLLLLFIEC